MKGILLIVVIAVIVEAVVEYAKSVYNLIAQRDFKTILLQAAAIAVAVLLCFSANADLFSALDIRFSHAGVGVLLTGIFASRGANYVSDLIGKLQSMTGKSQ